jgi:DNA-binding transcriptional regulator YiaG
MNKKDFAEYLGIPYRTLQDWELRNTQAPEYVLRLIAYKVQMEKERGNL